jgi:hypothetical protein
MKQQIAITDLTRMQQPKVCIAGYARDGSCIRPVIPFKGIGEWFLRKDGHLIIRPFAVVELDFLRRVPEAPHSEDWEIDTFYRKLVTPQLPDEKKQKLLEKTAISSVAEIFGTEVHHDVGCYVRAGKGERSLGTIRPAEVLELIYEPKDNSTWDYRIVFKDHAAQTYRLAITDLTYRHYLDYGRVELSYPVDDLATRLARVFNQRTTFLRIGLARGWEKFPDRCYLQVTGIYTFPDYLRGRTFTDFVASHPDLDGQADA